MNRLETYASQQVTAAKTIKIKKGSGKKVINNSKKATLEAFLPTFKKAIDASNTNILSTNTIKVGPRYISATLMRNAIIEAKELVRLEAKMDEHIKKNKFDGFCSWSTGANGILYFCVEAN